MCALRLRARVLVCLSPAASKRGCGGVVMRVMWLDVFVCHLVAVYCEEELAAAVDCDID